MLGAGAPLGTGAFAAEPFEPTVDFKDMRVIITYVSTGALLDLQRRSGVNVDLRDVRQSHRHGFSILKRHLKTGALTCEIYLPSELRLRKVDDEATTTLGHELLHCMSGAYHR